VTNSCGVHQCVPGARCAFTYLQRCPGYKNLSLTVMFSPEIAGVSAISITILWDIITEKKHERGILHKRKPEVSMSD